jgi:hypothetical protein
MSRRGMYTENVDGALDQPVTHTPRRPPHRLGNPTPLCVVPPPALRVHG